MKVSNIPVSFIILNNLVPIGGLLFLGWTAFDILFFFWLDVTIIFLLGVFKIFMSQKSERLPFKYNEVGNHYLTSQFQVKIFTLLFLLVFYSVYTGTLLLIIHKTTGIIFPSNLLIIILSPLVSHLISFLGNYINKKEYVNISPMQQVSKTLLRTVPMIILVIFAGIFGQYIMLFVLLILKTIIDYYTHNKEHKLIMEVA